MSPARAVLVLVCGAALLAGCLARSTAAPPPLPGPLSAAAVVLAPDAAEIEDLLAYLRALPLDAGGAE